MDDQVLTTSEACMGDLCLIDAFPQSLGNERTLEAIASTQSSASAQASMIRQTDFG